MNHIKLFYDIAVEIDFRNGFKLRADKNIA